MVDSVKCFTEIKLNDIRFRTRSQGFQDNISIVKMLFYNEHAEMRFCIDGLVDHQYAIFSIPPTFQTIC